MFVKDCKTVAQVSSPCPQDLKLPYKKCLFYVLQIRESVREHLKAYFSNSKKEFLRPIFDGMQFLQMSVPSGFGWFMFFEIKLRIGIFAVSPAVTRHIHPNQALPFSVSFPFLSLSLFFGAPNQKAKRSHLHQENNVKLLFFLPLSLGLLIVNVNVSLQTVANCWLHVVNLALEHFAMA